MSGKLDQSLDEILSSRKASARRGRGSRHVSNAARNAPAPVGGVKKTTKVPVTKAGRNVSAKPAPGGGESKIIVSNLPADVNETQIKEYFQKSVGSVKRVTITYGPTGDSRGIATIVFGKATTANEAAKKLNGLLVDQKPMKVEVVVDASRAPPTEPVRGIGERITNPKAQPKAVVKPVRGGATAGETRGGRGGRGRGGRGGRIGRGKPKTAEELDAEMTDYFTTNGASTEAATNGDAAAANGTEDTGMDEVS